MHVGHPRLGVSLACGPSVVRPTPVLPSRFAELRRDRRQVPPARPRTAPRPRSRHVSGAGEDGCEPDLRMEVDFLVRSRLVRGVRLAALDKDEVVLARIESGELEDLPRRQLLRGGIERLAVDRELDFVALRLGVQLNNLRSLWCTPYTVAVVEVVRQPWYMSSTI